ncbi:MAG: hypothetical protein QW269_02395, partial [Candidatus Caldarchaeum sp.]
TIMKKDKLPDSHPIQFIYLERYGDKPVRNYKSVERGKLKPGKWYYLRAPRIFEEVLLPRLTHKLKDFAEIKRGFTTGANEFFYVKDITHLYEADYLANPRKFNEWGVNAKTVEELRKQGLIYIENEGGERFVIDRKDVKPVVRSPKQIRSYMIKDIPTLCIYTSNPGRFTQQYIKWGESKRFHKRPTFRGRRRGRQPWYKLAEFKPAHIFLPMSWDEIGYIPYSEEPIVCDHRLYGLYYSNPLQAWVFLNSTVFLLACELFCRRLGGGATDIMVRDYEEIPVPDLNSLNVSFDPVVLLSRNPFPYHQEVKESDRRELDRAVLKALGFNEHELDKLVDELHRAFVDVVEDRLIKAGRPLREAGREAGEVVSDDQDS